MEKKIFAAVIAAVAALIIYNGGWEIIKFLGDKVFAYPWNFAAIIILSLITMALIIGTVVVPIGIYKKILLPLTAVAAFAVIAAANIKIAAALAIMIVFFSGIFATLPRLMEFQDRLEIRRWKKRLEENEKRKERIAKICREVPQEHLV